MLFCSKRKIFVSWKCEKCNLSCLNARPQNPVCRYEDPFCTTFRYRFARSPTVMSFWPSSSNVFRL